MLPMRSNLGVVSNVPNTGEWVHHRTTENSRADSLATTDFALQDLVNAFSGEDNSPEVSEDEASGVANKVAPQTDSHVEGQKVVGSQDSLLSLLAIIAQVLSNQCKHALQLHAGLEQHAKVVKWAEDEIVKFLDTGRPDRKTLNGLSAHGQERPPVPARTPPPAPVRSGLAQPPEEPPPSLMWPGTGTGGVSDPNLESMGKVHSDVITSRPSPVARTGTEGYGFLTSASSSPPAALERDSVYEVCEIARRTKLTRAKTSSGLAKHKNGNTGVAMDSVHEFGPSDAEEIAQEGHDAAFSEARTVSQVLSEKLQSQVCAQCGNHLMPDAQFCRKCGKKVGCGETTEGHSSTPIEKSKVFNVLPVWNTGRLRGGIVCDKFTVKRRESVASRLRRNFRHMSVARTSTDAIVKFDSMVQNEKRCQFGLHPYTSKRACWDIMSLILVVYDMIMIPFQLFEPPQNYFIDVCTWTTRLFWTFDMVMSFITGVVTTDGHIEMHLVQIAKRYLKTWFPLDMMIVGSDWVEFFMSDKLSGAGYARAGKVSRAFRIIRMLRLLRLARMREVLGLILERIRSEKMIIMANVAKLTILLLGMAHVVACVWWGIGDSKEEENTWVHDHEYTRKSLWYQYTMSLHWSLSMFAGGMDEVTPKNTDERTYTIIVFLGGFVVASLFVSSLTSSMTQLDIIGSKQSQELSVLRRYLFQNGISAKLALRVQRNAQHAILEQQRLMPEESVTLLHNVSEPLRMELHFEMYSEPLKFHPWLSIYTFECPQVMRKVCHIGTAMSSVSFGDVIFNAGEIPAKPKMYFVTNGVLQYESMSGEETEVAEGTYIAEATLWTQWMHRGMLTASTDARLCVLDSKKFQEIAGSFHHSMVDPEMDPRAYAAEFVSALNEAKDDDELTDLPRMKDKKGRMTGISLP
mmetsp:Transcript_118053/g.220636  ORF Transcript_118053/g.220636 Transcript_118053/m.220636 type:complete len:914 (+) Transcript_118053:152-2893(+)